MIQLDRNYSSTGIISAGSGLYIKDETLKKYVLLVPTSDLPGGSAPETIENPLLTVAVNGQVEGKQTMEQKTFTFNWNRDNIRRLKQYAGKEVELLERDGMEYTGHLYNGTIAFDKADLSDNAIMNGQMWVTVTEDKGLVDDIRDIIAKTAIITSPLSNLVLTSGGSSQLAIEGSLGAEITCKSENDSIASASFAEGILTVNAVAGGNTIIEVKADGSSVSEATSVKTFMVTVEGGSID